MLLRLVASPGTVYHVHEVLTLTQTLTLPNLNIPYHGLIIRTACAPKPDSNPNMALILVLSATLTLTLPAILLIILPVIRVFLEPGPNSILK